jgi:PAS domain-containing protein
LIGKSLVTAVYAPASRSKAKKLLNRWRRKGRLRNEELGVLTKTGEIRDVLLNVEMIVDREGRVVLANPKACSVLEGEEGEIVGKDWFDSFIPEHERREVRKVFQQLMHGIVEPVNMSRIRC